MDDAAHRFWIVILAEFDVQHFPIDRVAFEV